MSVLVSYPSLVLHLHTGTRVALETEWLGFVSSSDFRQLITEALQLAKEHGVTAWIANDLLLGAVRPVDLQWVAEHVLPAMVEMGIVRFARIDSEQTMNRMLIGQMYQDATPQHPIEMCSFPDVQQAREWACG
jgi:hypothetical protein